MEQKITLFEYVTNQASKAIYSGIAERYFLATEFLNSYNDEVEGKTELAKQLTPFLHWKNIYVEKVELEEGETVQRYCVSFEAKEENGKEAFENYLFADRNLVACKKAKNPHKQKYKTNGEVRNLCRNRDQYNVQTLATLAFCIYFGHHPFCGREYHESLDATFEYDREFFAEPRGFIFDVAEGNANRFINGYQSKAWGLWNAITDTQRQFWTDTFAYRYTSYQDFYQAWKNAYPEFVLSQVKTPCDEKLQTLVFDENYALITSGNTIGVQAIRCPLCSNALRDRCEACRLSFDQKVAKFFSVKVKVLTKNPFSDEGKGEERKERELCLFDGKSVSLDMLGQAGNEFVIFNVIAAKKLNLLGLRCLWDEPIVVTCGSTERIFKKDGVIPLLPGTRIAPITGCTIVVPGEAADEPKKAEPPKKGEEKKEETKKPEINPQTPAKDAAPEIKEGEKQEEKPAERESAEEKTSPEKGKESAQPTQSKKEVETVYLEDDSTCTLLGTEAVERRDYFMYSVEGRKKGKRYSLKLFKAPTTEEEKKRQEDIIANIQKVLSMKCTLPPTFLYPKAVVKSQGFCEGKKGYIANELPEGVQPASAIINGISEFKTKKAKIKALIDLCKSFKQLHEKGLAYKVMRLANVYCETEDGRCWLVDNDALSTDAFQPTFDGSFDFLPAEVYFGWRQPDEYVDRYAVALLMFLLLYKRHPFDDCSYKDSARKTPEEKREARVVDPLFCFDKKTSAGDSPEMEEARKEWENTPEVVKALFGEVFREHVIMRDTPNGRIDLREKRPSLKSWNEALNKWLHSVK